ncbi:MULTISPECIES: glucosamine-6-phosphate deaminase [unclassified Mucilaginibacter]|uniref:glucosamine-6-phosphate deaminase n=2 Tax=Mucilaginibacter TaxID=423349 RepID=UPI002AC89A1F|nr:MULTISPECIES: glucosamine-6-phosphate deaminase [unclassified Mucilaginibacter]MEB0249101.1 glucosamine-6-phosphate deaminase [Mucilaginibacter sp. 5B2]MEB0262442.1 glucosamine-6-phosphate deaminase [Mucilaginibacter sp. 10I4]MEB0279267.1 glucosamine-6-phosphate deaminase [Mucilaginibacter sp. 10B2]WPX23221.1 glucosamine-6-phosphate deaminase [Mucilaginibacter sp. 5C4]
MARLNLLEETRYEKLPVTVYPDQRAASLAVAGRIAALIRKKQAASEPTVLGLATGVTPIQVYAELIRLHKEDGLSFKGVITFNLDEYYPMKPNAAQSYVTFMNENLFDHIDIDKNLVHIPNGTLPQDEVAAFCLEYERQIEELGGLDLQILGIGRTGHIGFNEPGSAPNSGTRLVTLDDLTRNDASRDFGGKQNVPTKAITMGVGTIFKAREIILMAWSAKKAPIVRKAVEGEISGEVPATFLQLSDNVEFVLDVDAASGLTRFDTPWLVSDCVWDNNLKKKAIIWLSGSVGKPILKLTEEDYNNNGMAQLAVEQGPVYQINIDIFNQVQHTITGWPGGKPGADDSQRPERAEPARKRSIVFSPHPDDDVISMGGTFIRLVDQGHDVHVAYQTSGNTAVWDDDVLRYMEFAIDFKASVGEDTVKLQGIYEDMRKFIDQKLPNQVDTIEIRDVKGFIRKTEAISGARFAGLPDSNIHFQALPFYESGKTKKNSVGEEDIRLTMELLQRVKPQQVFTAGDFADPHGTHVVCFNIIIESLQRLRKTESWVNDCWVWMYRGAWHEFATHEIEMAVPLSPAEVLRKRNAIFKHQSQKDRPVFPGDDAREFWVRAEDRNRESAQNYDRLGMAEYAAMEAFVRFNY